MAQLAHHDPLGDAEVGHLLAYLATISDPRVLSGRRHLLVAIPALAAAAVLTGARSLVSAHMPTCYGVPAFRRVASA